VIWAARWGDIEKLKRLKKKGYDFNVIYTVSIYYTCYSSLAASPSKWAPHMFFCIPNIHPPL